MNKKIWSVTIVVVMIFASIISAQNVALSQNNENYINDKELNYSDNRVLVVFDRETSMKFKSYDVNDFKEVECAKVIDLSIDLENSIKRKIKSRDGGFNNEDMSFNKMLCLELKSHDKEKVLEAVSILKNKEGVLSAEPDYVLSVFSLTPNDLYFSQQWGSSIISLPEAWDATTGSSTVYVGVIDSGIDCNHPELSNRIANNLCRTFLSGSAVAETSPTDPFGHGTQIAGIIGAAGNNSSGICGVCWNIKMVSLKVLDSSGQGYSSYAVAAINYANSKEIPIINMSLGWYSWASNYDTVMSTAINNYSGLLVCAAGNDNSNIDISSNATYPASYICSNILAVGASKNDDTKKPSSNYGTISVDIFAPGDSVLTTYPVSKCISGTHNSGVHYQNGYHFSGGTSIASPYVAGVAALIKACHPNKTAAQIKAAILNNGDYSSSLSNYCVSGSRLNAFKSIDSTHSYSYVNYGSNAYHRCDCSSCGYSVYRPHNLVAYMNTNSDLRGGSGLRISGYYCSQCGFVLQLRAPSNSKVINTIELF